MQHGNQELKARWRSSPVRASGIGRATVELFVPRAPGLLIADIDAERGEELARELGDAALLPAHRCSQCRRLQALVNFAVQRFGGLHIMFNNAGISGAQYPRFLDDDLTDFHRVIDVNLYSVMAGQSLRRQYMAKHGGGVIINNASMAGILPGQALVSYRASKAAIIHFSK